MTVEEYQTLYEKFKMVYAILKDIDENMEGNPNYKELHKQSVSITKKIQGFEEFIKELREPF